MTYHTFRLRRPSWCYLVPSLYIKRATLKIFSYFVVQASAQITDKGIFLWGLNLVMGLCLMGSQLFTRAYCLSLAHTHTYNNNWNIHYLILLELIAENPHLWSPWESRRRPWRSLDQHGGREQYSHAGDRIFNPTTHWQHRHAENQSMTGPAHFSVSCKRYVIHTHFYMYASSMVWWSRFTCCIDK